MAKNKDTTGKYILAIVIIVAAVGMFIAVLPSSVVSSENITGLVTATISKSAGSATEWTPCLDLGTTVKLGSTDGKSIVKMNSCTAQNLLIDVFCAVNADSFYTYKSTNPVQCPSGTLCLLDENGAAYCG